VNREQKRALAKQDKNVQNVVQHPRRILWVSNAPWAATGYGQQTAQAITRLKADGNDVAVASNYGLDNLDDDNQTSEYTSYGKPSKYDPQYSQDPWERYDHGGSQSGH
jgi:hypothetical protein